MRNVLHAIPISVVSICSMLSFTDARAANPPAAMKGWALFSWFGLECSSRPQLHSAPNDDSWCFALLPATNRATTTDDLAKGRVGRAELDKRLATLPRGAEILWNNIVAVDAPKVTLALPPEAQRRSVEERARQLGLALSIAPSAHGASLRRAAERFFGALVAGDALEMGATCLYFDDARALFAVTRRLADYEAEQNGWIRARVAEAQQPRDRSRVLRLDRVDLLDVTVAPAGGTRKREIVTAMVAPVVSGQLGAPIPFVVTPHGEWRAMPTDAAR